ncbi:MAG: metallopeptidase TldD-related protein [Defluviitaleaceae bacterium]|nr:metallopeptidase TldD-related protein [Defluviitaleaceae bacterium]
MINELYSQKVKKTILSVTNNKITGILKSDTAKTGLRLYNDGIIGVAGAIGVYDEAKLANRAKQMLNFKVPYNCEPAGNIERTVDLSDSFALSDEDFIKTSETLLEKLAKQYPQFAVNHQIIYNETETRLRNSNGANLVFKDKTVKVVLLMKHKESKNMMDSLGISFSRGYDLDDVFNTVSQTCAGYEEKVSLPEEKMPVVFLYEHDDILAKFLTDLNGRMMGTGASLFTDKIGQKLFADDFSLCVERGPLDYYSSFFDAEGTVLPGDSFALIENGVLKSPYSSKKIAKEFGYAATGSAGGEYDSVPDTFPTSINVRASGKTIKELLGGRKAIYVVFASGGDFTPQGEYASPVQCAFLFDGARLLGRLPQISIRSNVFDMFGKDFIGLSADGLSKHNPFKYLAMDMNVVTIGGWL